MCSDTPGEWQALVSSRSWGLHKQGAVVRRAPGVQPTYCAILMWQGGTQPSYTSPQMASCTVTNLMFPSFRYKPITSQPQSDGLVPGV